VAVRDLWGARLAADWATVYNFQDLSNLEQPVTREQFVEWAVANEPFEYKRADVLDVIADGDFGWAHVDSSVGLRKMPASSPRDVKRWEKWHVINGRWLLVPIKLLDRYPEAPAIRDAAAEKIIAEREALAWKARLERNWPALYELSDPEDRKKITQEQFVKAYDQLVFLERAVKWTQAIGPKGTVCTFYRLKLNDPSLSKAPPTESVVMERWVLREGAWYQDLEAEEKAGGGS